MKRLFNSLQGRVFLLSVLATLVVILLSSWIFSAERARYTRKLQQDFLVDHAVLILQDVQKLQAGNGQPGTLLNGETIVLDEAFLPEQEAFGFAVPDGVLGGKQDSLFWDATSWVEPRYTLADLPDAENQSRLLAALRKALSPGQVADVRIKQPEIMLNELPAALPFGAGGIQSAVESTLILSLLLKDGRAVNIMPIFSAQEEPLWDRELLLLIGSLFICMVLINLLAATWMTRPLVKLEKAAARFGRDLDAPLLPEKGVTEVAQAGKAFNRMQQQITGLIEGRTAMLAAISHDLRTPITRLRLRSELLKDEQAKADIDKDLQDITAMVDATLGFLRNDALVEKVEAVNLAELVQDYCVERQSVGDNITVAEMPVGCQLSLRPLAVKRALGNLIDNGLHYGEQVTVSLHYEVNKNKVNEMLLRVCDDGPGIPEHLRTEVVKPFVRGEQSRNYATGGTGLGLSIVTSIMQLHGGELRLENVPDGFCALMVFPTVE